MVPAALNQTTQHGGQGKREQCDFADTDEFYNSLLEKATKKNVHSLNFMDLNAQQQNSKASFNNTLLQ
jgi:hypothetical protein